MRKLGLAVDAGHRWILSVLESLRSYFREAVSCSSHRKRPRCIQGPTVPHLVEPLDLPTNQGPTLQEQDIASSIKETIRPFKRKLQKIAQVQEMGLEDLTERLTRIEMAQTNAKIQSVPSERVSSEQCKDLLALADCLFYTSRQIDDQDILNILQERVNATLTSFSVTRIPLKDIPFDDHQHEAREIGHDPQHPNNWVLETLRPGYLYEGRLLRPAWVVVNQID
ncbi:MAG: nucleotide exchange factor GrpE [Nitrospiraceae bacterium]|nr:nucleotide exchange factor GrpE [Nitrospiraceae bacterium]